MSTPIDWGVAMLAKPERQALSRRLFEALSERLPDRYVMLTVVVVAPLAFGAFVIAFMLPPPYAFAP